MDKGYLIAEEVKMKLMRYKIFDKEKIEKVQKIIEFKREQWDKSVTTKDDYIIDDLTLLLAYEYCLATEKITLGRISFEEALDKLSEVDKFRLGEPKLGDAIVVYGKSVNDPEAISVVSEEYDNVRKMTGAQYTDYVGEDGNLKSAVFIFGKKY